MFGGDNGVAREGAIKNLKMRSFRGRVFKAVRTACAKGRESEDSKGGP